MTAQRIDPEKQIDVENYTSVIVLAISILTGIFIIIIIYFVGIRMQPISVYDKELILLFVLITAFIIIFYSMKPNKEKKK